MEDSNNNLENENKIDNKKKIIFMVIGLVIMLILVIGSTYAYFSVDVNNSETSASVTVNTGKIGNATLTTTESDLYLNVSAQDMAETNVGKTYWATPNEEEGRIESEEVKSHKIAEVKIDGGEDDTNYKCTADVVVTAEGSMMYAIYGEGNRNELVFNLSSTVLDNTTDFYWNGLSNKTIKWNFKIQGNKTAELYAYLKLENLDLEQDYLAGTNLQMNIETQNLKCEVYEPFTGGTGLELAKSQQPGLSKELVGGMYRFQGTNEDVDNYLCFGTKCDNESDDMYRIIGVTKEGNIKVIKQMSIGDKEWWTDNGLEIKWPDSNLYKYLNTFEDNFYDTLDETIKGKIENYNWKYGDVNFANFEFLSGGLYNAYYAAENNWNESIQAPIGLMHRSDYIYSASEEKYNKWMENGGFDRNSWMSRSNNGESLDNDITSHEWTMDRYNRYGVWSVSVENSFSETAMDGEYQTFEFAVRPVFFLKSTAEISFGNGTPENPFVIE